MTTAIRPPGPPPADVGHHLMLSFIGLEAPAPILTLLGRQPVAGFTLYRSLNVRDPAQVRALTAALQAAVQPGGGGP